MPRKAVFFDRDDTLIEDRVYLNDPDDIHYLDGVFEAVKKVSDAGFEIVVVTNQSGVAQGIVDTKNIFEIHRRIRRVQNTRPLRSDRTTIESRNQGCSMRVSLLMDLNPACVGWWVIG
ncbi:MAG: HAD-IIIA family hydrolase [Bdellovibrionales bacterium]